MLHRKCSTLHWQLCVGLCEMASPAGSPAQTSSALIEDGGSCVICEPAYFDFKSNQHSHRFLSCVRCVFGNLHAVLRFLGYWVRSRVVRRVWPTNGGGG